MNPPQDTTLIAPFWEYVTAPHYVSIHAKFSDAVSEFPSEGQPTGFEGILLRHIGSHWDAILLFAALQRESDEFCGGLFRCFDDVAVTALGNVDVWRA